MNCPRISIIILNWNRWRDTIECLSSLINIKYNNYDIVIVDNNSKDNSLNKLDDYIKRILKYRPNNFDYRLKNIHINNCTESLSKELIDSNECIETLSKRRLLLLLKMNENYGYAKGNNIALKYALKFLNPKYVLILNNDTIVEKNFLQELVVAAENDVQIGFIGPIVYYYNFNDRINIIHSAGAKIDMLRGEAPPLGGKEIDDGKYKEPFQVDYLEGACLLVRADILKKVGLLNPDYFAYWEEADWCQRARNAGYRIICVPRAKIWHKINDKEISLLKIYYMTRNMFLFMRIHSNNHQYLFFLLYFFAFKLWFTLMILIYYRNYKAIPSFWMGVFDGLTNVRGKKKNTLFFRS